MQLLQEVNIRQAVELVVTLPDVEWIDCPACDDTPGTFCFPLADGTLGQMPCPHCDSTGMRAVGPYKALGGAR
jgi:hypothetical protein